MEDSTLKLKLQNNRTNGFKWQQRRHPQWTESYELYRDTVIVNRLTQRQSVNVPLMKETIKTLLSKFQKRKNLVFEDLGGDKQKEIFKNEYWVDTVKKLKLRAKDVVNKKQVLLYGRSFWKLLIADGEFYAEVIDPQDILIDRYADPADLETAQFIIHQHIYRPLSEVENNPAYDKEAITNLKNFYATEQGLIKSSETEQSMREKNERMENMGVPDISNPVLGETYVELNEHYVKLWDENKKKFVLHIVTTCNDEILRNKPLKDILNVEFFPFVSWADDLERSDIWSDGVADIIRTINKILNAFFSQLIENRTLRNFGMHFYDSSANENWSPQTFEPVPFGWYPLPGKPADIMQSIEIPDLSESLDEMTFLIQMAERATGATATNKGTGEKNQITLGEVQILLKEALDRVEDLQDAYDLSWEELGTKWSEMVDANADKLKAVKLYKKSHKGNYFEQEVKPSDWKSKAGYACILKSADEKEKDDLLNIQKLLAVKGQFPNNIPLQRVVKEKMLGVTDISPELQKEIMDFEDQNPSSEINTEQPQPGQPEQPQPDPMQLNPQENALQPA
jgi:hypothetical protein